MRKEGNTSQDTGAPARAESPPAGPSARRRNPSRASSFRTETDPARDPSFAAKVDRFSARVAEQVQRGGRLTERENRAVLELIDAIAALLRAPG